MHKKIWLFLAISFTYLSLSISLIACSNTESKENLEKEKIALTSLKKLHSKIELGINIKDYSESLQEAKFAVEQITVDSESSKLMKSSLERHILALNWWRCDLEGYDNDKDVQCRDALLPDIFQKSPLVKSKAEPLIEKSEQTYKSRAIDKNAILQLIWLESQKDLVNAENTIVK
ncbi:MAG: hypothetical protein PT116_18895 [Aphanizomenon gracile PMC638.10]|nr:hypothetical protein [Aphanizomenon gracile PMC638.10]